MHKMYVMYNLKPGVTMEQYRLWSKEIDQRITPGQPGMIRFEIYEMLGSETGGEPFLQIVEDIEVEDFDAWMETTRQEGMAYVESTLPSLIETLLVVGGSRGTLGSITMNPQGGAARRISWREILRD